MDSTFKQGCNILLRSVLRITGAVVVLILLLVYVLEAAHAAPFVVGDVCSANCNKCVWDGTGFGPLINDVLVDTVNGSATCGNRVCKRDVSGALVGTNNITLACRDSTSLWGDSAIVPFSFVRPAPPTAPSGMRLVP